MSKTSKAMLIGTGPIMRLRISYCVPAMQGRSEQSIGLFTLLSMTRELTKGLFALRRLLSQITKGGIEFIP
jgi:hypothetical protein